MLCFIKLVLVINSFYLVHSRIAIQGDVSPEKSQNESANKAAEAVEIDLSKLEPNTNQNNENHPQKVPSSPAEPKQNVTKVEKNVISNDNLNKMKITQMESGAVLRGVLVFVVISVLFIMYLAYKNYRRNNKRVNVRKYGVRTRRSDLEMTPLPLDEDDDDETVFDMENLNRK